MEFDLIIKFKAIKIIILYDMKSETSKKPQ